MGKGLGYVLLTLIILVMIGVWMLSRETYQNWLVKQATKYLSEKLHTTVAVKHIKLSFFNDFNIDGVYIADDRQDTLAYIGRLQLKTSELIRNLWKGENAVITSVHLQDASIYLHRTKDTSRWNYDFIADAFSGKSNATDTNASKITQTNESSSPTNPGIDIHQARFERVKFYMDDAWRGEDMRFAWDDVNVELDQIDWKHKKIDIQKIFISGANILVKEYEGGKPEDHTPDDTTSWGTPFNPDLYKIRVAKFNLANSSFNFINNEKPPTPHVFDETHVGIADINIDISDAIVNADTIFANIEHLSAKERSGLHITNLQAKAKVSQVESELSSLVLQTPYSEIKDYYAMRYRNFHDFNDYINKVTMVANLSASQISSIDIGFFASIVNEYPIAVKASGKAIGTVTDMKATQLNVSVLHTSFIGDAHITGLPDVNKALFEVSATKLKTTGNDLNALIPQTKTDAVAWHDLHTIEYMGTYTGHVDDFYTKGHLQTNMGSVRVDINMNFKEKIASYKGQIETQQLQLGQLLHQQDIGIVSMKGTIDGKGFDMNSLDAKVNATIQQIDIAGASYQQLTINGLVANKKFDGIFISQDEKLSLNFNGKLDISGKQPVYQFSSRFIAIDLQKIGITKDPVVASGIANLNFTGNDIDNFTGTALLKNITVTTPKHKIYADEFLLESYTQQQEKTLRVSSNFADAELKGKFILSDLANAVQLYIYHYLPEYIKRPQHFKDQQFVFHANIKKIDTILHAFVPNLHGISGSYIDGELNTFTQKLSLDANIPQIGYNDFLIKNVGLVGAGDFNSLDFNITTQNLLMTNEVIVPSMQINSSMAHDTASLSINTQSINELLGDASINCKATAFNSNLYINLLPSNFKIQDDNWQFYSHADIVIGDHILINNLMIENGAQKISINSANTLVDNVQIDIQELDLEGISNYAGLYPTYFGRLNGNIFIQDITGNQTIQTNLRSNGAIIANTDTIGEVKLISTYDVHKKILQLDPQTSILRNNHLANIQGTVNGTDSTINIATTLDKLSISFLNQFISAYIQHLKGEATGNVYIKGALQHPQVSGNIKLNDVSLKVLFLGTTYFIDEANMKFNNQQIEMNNFYLRDEREGNYTGIVQGSIAHRNFSDFFLNFSMNSPNLLCLQTKETDNDLFYGYVPAKLHLQLSGPLDDIDVDMNVKPLKGAKFYLPINSKGDASTYDYVIYKQFGRYQNEQLNKKKSSSYVKLNMNIEATPDAETYIILDANTGEEIIAKGNGDLQLIVDLGNSIEMYGTYLITEGMYKFNFRGLFNKDFIIDNGSKITWNGDALDAKMDLTALYKLPQKKALYPLVSQEIENNASEIEEARKQYTTYVSIIMKNSLLQPDFVFGITQPDNKAVGTLAYNKLEQLKNDEKELIAQAGALLLFGDFKPVNGGFSNENYRQGAVSTVSDVITQALSNEINNQIQKLTGISNVKLNIDYQNATRLDKLSAVQRNELILNISTNLWKDRVVVDLSNNFDITSNNNSNNTNASFFNGEFKAQFLLTEDGRLRINTYANNTPDLAGNNFYRGGVGLFYRRSFNHFRELVTSKKSKKNTIRKNNI